MRLSRIACNLVFAGCFLLLSSPFPGYAENAVPGAPGLAGVDLALVRAGRPATLIPAPEVTAEILEGVEAAWLWSAEVPPRRYSGEALREAWPDLVAVGWGEPSDELQVHLPQDGERPSAEIVAAPAMMWQEIPEAWLPRFAVPVEGSLVLPRDRQVGWRLRYIGTGVAAGTWAREVVPGKAAVRLVPRPARDSNPVVVSPDGVGVAGAMLTVLEAVEGTARPGVTSVHRSDGEGRLRLTRLPEDRPANFAINAGGYAPRIYRGRLRDLPPTLTLAPAATLRGAITDGDGVALPGATIIVEGWLSDEVPVGFRRQTVSGADGGWLLSDLPLREMVLTAQLENFAALRHPLELTDSLEVDLGKLVMSPAASLSIRVTGRDRVPLSLARVSVDHLRVPAAISDEAGLAELHGLPGRRALDLTVSRQGYLDQRGAVVPPWPREVEVEMVEGFTVAGRYVDPQGQPVLGTQVKIRNASRFEYRSLGADATVDELLEPGMEYVLEFSSPRHRRSAVKVAPGLPGERRDLGEIVALPGLTVYGSLVSAVDGAPVPGGRLWASRNTTSGELMSWLFKDLVEAESGEDGSFEISGLEPVPGRIRIEAPGFAREEISVAPEDGVAVIDAGVVELDAGAAVVVRVQGGGEAADSGLVARFDLQGEWDPLDMLTATVVEGEAVFAHVPAGTGRVLVEAGRDVLLCEKDVEVGPEDELVEVVCDARRSPVSGRVVVGDLPAGTGLLTWAKAGEGGEREAAIMTRVSPSGLRQQGVFGGGRPQVRVEVAEDGTFNTERLSTGRWRVTWQPASGAVAGPREVEVPDGEVRDLLVRFEGQGITGVVVDDEGLPVPRATVREVNLGSFAYSRSDGRFAMVGLRPGVLRLQAREGDRYSDPVEVVLEPDRAPDPVRLTVSVEHAGEVPVRVWTGSGTPAAGAFVFLEPEGSGRSHLLSADPEGLAEVTIPAPYPERVRVAAYHQGAWALGDWVGWEGAREGLQLQLVAGGGLWVRSDETSGLLDVTTSDGWNLGRLMARLGTAARVSPEQPLVLNLPEGRYAVTFRSPVSQAPGAAAPSVLVREGRVEELTLSAPLGQ